MKKKVHVIIIFLLLSSVQGFTQHRMEWNLGILANWHGEMNVFNQKNMLDPLEFTTGASLELKLDLNRNLVQLGLGSSTWFKESDEVYTRLNSLFGNAYFGRYFPIGNESGFGLLVGYKHLVMGVNGYSKNIEPGFNDLTIENSSGMISLQNAAHCLSLRVDTRLYGDSYFSIAYNYALNKDQWRMVAGKIQNSPTEQFSMLTASFLYSISAKTLNF